MSVAINLNDELAGVLAEKAKKHRQSLEEFTVNLLQKAVNIEGADPDWNSKNQRRLELIRKSVQDELTDREQGELDDLQLAFDKRFESFDKGLLGTVTEIRAVGG